MDLLQNNERKVITLDDYLHQGLAVPTILENFSADLRKGSLLDMLHATQTLSLLGIYQDRIFQDNLFHDVDRFFDLILEVVPDALLSLKGRLKAVISFEKKQNMLIFKTIERVGKQPSIKDFVQSMNRLHDALAFRGIFTGKPEEELVQDIDKIANEAIEFFIKLGYVPMVADMPIEISKEKEKGYQNGIKPEYRIFFKDYIRNPKANGYMSLHLLLYHPTSGRFIEFQFRTLIMHLNAETGTANWKNYKNARYSTDVESIPEIEDAIARCSVFEDLDLRTINVIGFDASDPSKEPIDSVGLYIPKEIYSRKNKFDL